MPIRSSLIPRLLALTPSPGAAVGSAPTASTGPGLGAGPFHSGEGTATNAGRTGSAPLAVGEPCDSEGAETLTTPRDNKRRADNLLRKAVVKEGAEITPGPTETVTQRATGLTTEMLRRNERRSLYGLLVTAVRAGGMRGGVGIGFRMSSAEDTIIGGDRQMELDAGEPAKLLVPDFRSLRLPGGDLATRAGPSFTTGGPRGLIPCGPELAT